MKVSRGKDFSDPKSYFYISTPDYLLSGENALIDSLILYKSKKVIIFSNAKINIGLHILRKRDDGFHDISTLMVPVPFNDIIEINLTEPKGNGFSMNQSGITVPGNIEDNLCYRSWELFCRERGMTHVQVHLHKRIPLGAGLGGGSSNAVAILKGLNSLTGNKLKNNDLHNLASQLGSDCNLFVENKPALAAGRGEILSDMPVSLKGLHLVLLNPGIPVNTAWAYSNSSPNEKREPLQSILSKPMHLWKTTVINDFEVTVFEAHPEVAGLKAELYMAGAIFTSMSGSGSTVYGLFTEQPVLNAELEKQLLWQGKL
jgi:4-diphosphocytidyl-2-C-methyl-D-erythritol kinase